MVSAVWRVVWDATWGNNMATVEVAVVAFLARDHLGRKLAAWWAKHYAPHAVDHHRAALWQTLREHDAKSRPGSIPPRPGSGGGLKP